MPITPGPTESLPARVEILRYECVDDLAQLCAWGELILNEIRQSWASSGFTRAWPHFVICWYIITTIEAMWHLQGGRARQGWPVPAQHRYALWHAWLQGPAPHVWSGSAWTCGADENGHHRRVFHRVQVTGGGRPHQHPDACQGASLSCPGRLWCKFAVHMRHGAGHAHRGLPRQERAGLWPECWGCIPQLWTTAQQGDPPMAGLWGGSPWVEMPVACRQRALGVTGPAPLACGWLSSRHPHGVPVPQLPVLWSRLSCVQRHLTPHYCREEAGAHRTGWRILEGHLWLHTHDHLGVRVRVPWAHRPQRNSSCHQAMAPGRLTMDLLAQIAVFVYAYPKLCMLQLWYDLLGKYTDHRYWVPLYIDTDGYYMSLGRDSLHDCLWLECKRVIYEHFHEWFLSEVCDLHRVEFVGMMTCWGPVPGTQCGNVARPVGCLMKRHQACSRQSGAMMARWLFVVRATSAGMIRFFHTHTIFSPPGEIIVWYFHPPTIFSTPHQSNMWKIHLWQMCV